MSNDICIHELGVSISEVQNRADMGSMIRVYHDTDDRLALQLRKTGPITSGPRARWRNMLAHVSITAEQALILRNALTQFLGGKRRFSPVGDTSNAGSTTNNFKFTIRTDNPQQAYDMARLMLAVGNLYGTACCVDGTVEHGPWPWPLGSQLSPEAKQLLTLIRALLED